jgi:hypothetical protein
MTSAVAARKAAAGQPAESAHDESTGKTRIWVWTHKQEDDATGEVVEDTLSLVIPRKFKRFKFMRRIAQGDLVGALELVFGPDALRPMDDWDMANDEWDAIQTSLNEAINDVSTGN